MYRSTVSRLFLFGFLLGSAAFAAEPRAPQTEITLDAASRVADRLPREIRALATEIFERNPDLARMRRSVAAAEVRAPQEQSLPDPVVALTYFIQEPETRVGPLRARATVTQKIPWLSRLDLREQAALYEAAASREDLAALRLRQVTELRKLAHELQFLAAYEQVVGDDTRTLGHYEEIARARYASGVGLGQGVLKIQAEITRAESRRLEIRTRRASLLARINALRDRPAQTPLELGETPTITTPVGSVESWLERALRERPELRASRWRLEGAEAAVQISEKDRRPDFSLGFSWGWVDPRRDAAGREQPPEGNGRDDVGFMGSVSVPLYREGRRAAVEEAGHRRAAASEEIRSVEAAVRRDLEDVAHRLPLLRERWSLLHEVLEVQAEESLRSAETAYASGSLNSLDLLDAQRILLEVRIAVHRAATDHAVAWAELEGAVAASLVPTSNEENPS